MVVALLLALQAGAQQPRPRAPQRPLADPGVIAVEQRVTPAGVQSVFDGKVGGVRFGKNPGELWVVVPGAAYRLAWRDNRAITSSAYDGRAGVHGVAIDPVTGRAIVSSVGKLPGNTALSRTPGQGPLARAEAVAHVKAYSADTDASAREQLAGQCARRVFLARALGDLHGGRRRHRVARQRVGASRHRASTAGERLARRARRRERRAPPLRRDSACSPSRPSSRRTAARRG